MLTLVLFPMVMELVAVIALVHHRAVNDPLQLAEVDDVAGDRVGLALERDLKDVIMPVPVRVRAESVLPLIPGETLGRIIQPVRGIEMHLSRDENSAAQRARRAVRILQKGGWEQHALPSRRWSVTRGQSR